MKDWTLVEPCCGAASLATHVCGLHSYTLLPYQGSKWRVRKLLSALLEEHGFEGPPIEVYLSDIGPWGAVWQALPCDEARALIIARLKHLNESDPFLLYDLIHGGEVPECLVDYVTEYLFLQRLTFNGKAVSDAGGVWKSPGFNKVSAYGQEAYGKFGEIKPMLPCLIRRLEEFDWAKTEKWFAGRCPAGKTPAPINERTVVYLDPPYEETTKYPCGSLTRQEVISLARKWSDRGAFVVVSEGKPLVELEWPAMALVSERMGDSTFRGRSPEWVTYNGEGR